MTTSFKGRYLETNNSHKKRSSEKRIDKKRGLLYNLKNIRPSTWDKLEIHWNDLICKYNKTESKHKNKKRRDAWAALTFIMIEKNDVMMNTKVWVQNLAKNKVVLIVLYHDMEITLAQCTTYSDLYGTGLIDHKFFIQT